MIGHSVGEYVAACLAGVFELEDALSLVAARGRLMQSMPKGAMVAAVMTADRARAFVGADVWLSAINGPSLCVLSTSEDKVDALERRLQSEGVGAKRLETSHAFHSPMMDPIVDEFAALVSRTSRRAPRIPFVSNLTGAWISDAEAQDPGYWARHLRQPVHFADGVAAILDDSRRVLLEVGPGRTLAGLAKQHPACDQKRVVVASLPQQRAGGEPASAIAALGRLWAAGIAVDWSRFYQEERRRRVVLPTYPFERRRYWIDPAIPAAAPARRAAERAALDDWFHIPSWKRSATGTAAAEAGRWLVFADEVGVAAAATAALREKGHEVIVVEAGESFARNADDRFAIDPAAHEHYRQLFSTLKQAARLPDVIAHFWGVTATDGLDADSEQALQRGFYSLMFLAQALGETQPGAAVRVGVVASGLYAVGSDEALSPSKAAVMGPVRVIPREYPQVACRAIDIVAAEWQTTDPRRVAALIDEIASAGDDVVAHRRADRWVPTLEAVRFEPVAAGVPSRLREGGVYLITGGTGGIGLTLAGYLARSVKAKLVLTSRTSMPARSEWITHLAARGEDDRMSRQIRAIESLEQAGAEVLLVRADSSRFDDVAAAVEEARSRFGRIDGVIHAAGVAGGGIIQLKDREAAAKVLAPKVAGVDHLSRVFDGAALDFLVLCSSMTSLVGGGGQVDYCGANACLDAFAHAFARQTGTYTVAINWDAWREVGMAVDTTAAGDARRLAALSSAIGPDEGVEAFARILSRNTHPQVAVATRDLTRAAEQAPAGTVAETAAAAPKSETLARYERPELQTGYVAPVSEIENAIADVWQNALGIDRIGRDDNFFELGGHSLLLVQAQSSLAARLGRSIPITDLFEFPTVASLARHLGGGESERVPMAAPAPSTDRARSSDSIAIIGMACRLPGAPDVETFWANLRDGVESIEPLSEADLRQRGVSEVLLAHPRYVKAAGSIDGADLFDAAFFGYSPREAELIDPQHRLFLECAWEAFERAGYDPKRYPGAAGVYAGIGASGYSFNVFSNPRHHRSRPARSRRRSATRATTCRRACPTS